MNRREMLRVTSAAVAGASMMGLNAFAATETPQKKKVLVIGAHPDDPETGCGGTMLWLKEAGCEVVAVYMTKGEGGISGKTHSEAVAIRVPEAQKACEILGVRPVFLSQIDGHSEVNKERYQEMRDVIAAENPDVVLTHWPIDSHPDHRVCSLLVYDAWRRLGHFELFYFEVMSGVQTQLFHPTDWVDISKVAEQKRAACYCHVSQAMPELYEGYHDPMEVFRGLEARCKRAEAFVHLRRTGNDLL